MSETLNAIITSKRGYRNEEFSSTPSSIPTLRDMLEGEIEDSGNTDVIDYLKYTQNVLLEKVDDIIEFVMEQTGIKNEDDLHALWLTTQQGVLENYFDTNEDELFSYNLNDIAPLMVLSDLDCDGVLFVTLASRKFRFQENFYE